MFLAVLEYSVVTLFNNFMYARLELESTVYEDPNLSLVRPIEIGPNVGV